MSSARAILPPEPTAILPPERGRWRRYVYTPNCPQYRNVAAGEIQVSPNGSEIRGNCSPNERGQQWDFHCYSYGGQMRCHASNGRMASSVEGICCPRPSPG